MLTTVIIQPNNPHVLTLEPEFVAPQDGHTKPDCELPAAKRWKVENENNNVLKSHGYHLEHNFGHGQLYQAIRRALGPRRFNR